MSKWSQISHQPAGQILKLQAKQFSRLLKRLSYHPFYAQYSSSLHSLADLSKLPFTTKADLLPDDNGVDHSRDFIFQPTPALVKKQLGLRGLFFAGFKKLFGSDIKSELEDEFKPVHIHFTTGRSAQPVPFLYSAADMRVFQETGRRIFETIGAKTSDVAINCFPFAPHLAFWLGYHVTNHMKVFTLHTGGGKVLGTDKIILSIEKLRATILMIIPGYGYHLLREAVRQKRDFSQVRLVVLGGERVSPGLRTKIKEMLIKLGAKNPRVLSTYAFTESKTAWVQCHEESGYHLYPDLEYVELVDEDGNPVKEGASGEVVYTGLGWRGTSVMKYLTGDICRSLTTSTPCPYCHRTVPLLHYDVERKSHNISLELTKIKGELINLNDFYLIMHKHPEIAEWQIEIAKQNNDPYDLDVLYLNLALTEEVESPEATVNKISQQITTDTSVTPTIRLYPLAEMVKMLEIESAMKEKRIIDKRKEKR